MLQRITSSQEILLRYATVQNKTFVCLFVCLRSIEMNNILNSEYYLKKEMIRKGELQSKKLEREN